jgi:hypothetical protein
MPKFLGRAASSCRRAPLPPAPMPHTRAPRFGAGAWAVLQLVAWAALFLGAAAHAAARHSVRSRGWQLNRALVALLAALTAVASLHVVVTWRPDDTGALAAYAVTYDLSDAAFLALLMVRAARMCAWPRLARRARRSAHVHACAAPGRGSSAAGAPAS